MENYFDKHEIEEVLNFRCPRYDELPTIFLYKDQIIGYIENILKPLGFYEMDRILTPTMLNNYVKQKIVSPPVNKKYSTKHVAYIIVVCLLKQNFSLSEICKLIQIQINTSPIEDAYNYFCLEFESALNFAFSDAKNAGKSQASRLSPESELVRSCAISVAHKLHIQRCLQKYEEIGTDRINNTCI